MAFVSRAQRKLHTVNSSGIGPGAYLDPSHYASNPSFAPFASTSERNFNKVFCNNVTPGPGSYMVNNGEPLQKAIDHWGNSKFSVPFACGVDRFKYNQNALSPGPGSYSISDKWKAKKNIAKSQIALNFNRTPSAPSIPANHQTFGYDDSQTGELIMQKNPEKVHSGNPKDSVGPGHYSVTEIKKPKGPKWHNSNQERNFYNNPTTGPEIGPGSYSESKLSIAPMYKFKKSAVFASTVNEHSAEMKKNDWPGPGSYAVENFGAFSKVKQKKPSVLQNFGSSSIRFDKKRNTSEVGPGHYNDPNGTSAISKSFFESKVPFSSSNTRFRYGSNLTPGPGTYQDFDFTEKVKKKAYSRQGVFGSSEKRFPTKSKLQTPGPGYYREVSKKLNKSEMHKPSAAFASKSTRNNQNFNSDMPAPGTYEIPTKFGAAKPPAASMHPVLSRVTKSQNDGGLGFASRANRFDEENFKKVNTPGPGTYEAAMKNKRKKVIISKEERFKNEKKYEIPGPGAYCEEAGEWNKKSFNVLFSDIS